MRTVVQPFLLIAVMALSSNAMAADQSATPESAMPDCTFTDAEELDVTAFISSPEAWWGKCVRASGFVSGGDFYADLQALYRDYEDSTGLRWYGPDESIVLATHHLEGEEKPWTGRGTIDIVGRAENCSEIGDCYDDEREKLESADATYAELSRADRMLGADCFLRELNTGDRTIAAILLSDWKMTPLLPNPLHENFIFPAVALPEPFTGTRTEKFLNDDFGYAMDRLGEGPLCSGDETSIAARGMLGVSYYDSFDGTRNVTRIVRVQNANGEEGIGYVKTLRVLQPVADLLPVRIVSEEHVVLRSGLDKLIASVGENNFYDLDGPRSLAITGEISPNLPWFVETCRDGEYHAVEGLFWLDDDPAWKLIETIFDVAGAPPPAALLEDE